MLGGFNFRQAMRLQRMAQKSMRAGQRAKSRPANPDGSGNSNVDAIREGGKAAGKMGLQIASRQVINRLIRGLLR